MHINDLNAKVNSRLVEIESAIKRVLSGGRFVLGAEVSAFEEAFARYIGASHCISVANGSDAIELALKGLNIAGDSQVALAANAGMYATTAILSVGAIPTYVDVNFATGNISFDGIKAAIGNGAQAVVVTHLYGLAINDISEIANFCAQKNIPLIEDCAQAHGATIDGKKVGSFGSIATFSFYPTKNLGALGDGGAVVTSDEFLAARICSLRQYGWEEKYSVTLSGGRNSRLDELQAAILLEFLPVLDASNQRRRNIAEQYNKGIRADDFDIILPTWSGEDYVGHLYVIKTPNRDSLREHLRKQEIFTEIHYPIPDYCQKMWNGKYDGFKLKNTERLAREVLTLPCYPEMNIDQINSVIKAINSFNVNQF